MTSIELRNVFTSGRLHARLDDVSLVVPAGSSLAVTGPAGSGTTTLLRVLVGLDDHRSGDVVIDDVVVNGLGPRDRDVAMVFDDFALHPHLDVFDNLAFSATLRRGFDKVALSDRIHEVAESLALADLLETKPADLTEAQRQRVALGRTLVRNASAYVFDQPFSAQSERVRSHVRSVTTQWQGDQERTSVFATDDVEEALSVADRVAVMHHGRVRQVGTPRELYDSPTDLFVAGFLGAPAMNLLPGRPSGQQVGTPIFSMLLDDALQERIGDRDFVVVGVRSEDCHDATGPVGSGIADRVELTSRVDDVEWRGSSQLAYLGFDIDPDDEPRLDDVETRLDFDLFQSFLVAEVSGETVLRPGMAMRVVIPRDKIHVFDAETGENLSLGRA